MVDNVDAPLYKCDHRLIYDPVRDDILVARFLPMGDDGDIADRVGGTTFAHSTRAYPRQPPSVQRGMKAVLKDPHPTFQVVSASEAADLTARLQQPTFSTKLRQKSADPTLLCCPGPKSGKYDKRPGPSILKKEPTDFSRKNGSRASSVSSRRDGMGSEKGSRRSSTVSVKSNASQTSRKSTKSTKSVRSAKESTPRESKKSNSKENVKQSKNEPKQEPKTSDTTEISKDQKTNEADTGSPKKAEQQAKIDTDESDNLTPRPSPIETTTEPAKNYSNSDDDDSDTSKSKSIENTPRSKRSSKSSSHRSVSTRSSSSGSDKPRSRSPSPEDSPKSRSGEETTRSPGDNDKTRSPSRSTTSSRSSSSHSQHVKFT